ncbi:MAG: hypothetical protein ACI865_001647 [Flavobacteriaceae bacterium]
MKKLLLLLTAILSIGVISCKKKGCTDPAAVNYSADAKKDDESCKFTPTIVITGNQTMTVLVGDTYTDAGATATNADGSAANVTTDISQINTSVVGSFVVSYSAANENGTSTAERTVNVVFGQASWLGTGAVTDDCNFALFPLANAPVISAGGSATELVISNMFDLVGGSVNATINGASITIPQQTVNITLGNIILSGTGTMNASGTEFVVDYTYDNTTPIIGGTGNCTATYAL